MWVQLVGVGERVDAGREREGHEESWKLGKSMQKSGREREGQEESGEVEKRVGRSRREWEGREEWEGQEESGNVVKRVLSLGKKVRHDG